MRQSNGIRIIIWSMAGLLLATILFALGWFLGHHDDDFNPYQALKGYESSRHGFIVKSSQISSAMSVRAIKDLQEKNIKKAVEDCKVAIDIFPINTKPYILLTKLYLMTGQEGKMFDTLTLAGRSYPNFNNIVEIIDDEGLDKMPLDVPPGDIYLADFPENKKMAVSFMFDDGEANVYKALPTFEKYGYRATIPVVAGFVSDKSKDPFWGSWEEWKDAANRGFEIANHSMFHQDSVKLHGEDFDVAIDQAKEIIENNIGHPVTAFVFPHDSYNDESVSRALRVHKVIRTPEFLKSFYSRTVDIVIGGPHVSVDTANRMVDIGIKRRLWLIAKCHGVTEKVSMRSFKSITPEFLENHLAYIHSRSNEVWVDTFSNVFNYMYLRSQTSIETKAFDDHSIDFVMHSHDQKVKLSTPLTVVINSDKDLSAASAQSADGRALKAWGCDTMKLCVDVDAYETKIHVQFFKSPA